MGFYYLFRKSDTEGDSLPNQYRFFIYYGKVAREQNKLFLFFLCSFFKLNEQKC